MRELAERARSRPRSGPCRVMQRAAAPGSGSTARACDARARTDRGPARRRSRCGGSQSWISVCQRDRARRGCAAGTAMSVADAHRRSGRASRRRKRSSGGVIASRFRASAKNGNTSSGVPVAAAARGASDVDAGHSSLRKLRSVRFTQMTDLRSAAVPGPRARRPRPRPGRTPPLVLVLRATSPARAARSPATACRPRARPARASATSRCKAKHPRAVAAGPRGRGGRARRARSGRCTTRSTPTRGASTTRTCGRAASALGLDLDRFEADRRGAEARRARRGATSATRCAAGCDRDADRRADRTGRLRNCSIPWSRSDTRSKTKRPADRRAGPERKHI